MGDVEFPDVPAVKEALAPELHGTLVLDLAGVHSIVDDGLGLLVAASSAYELREALCLFGTRAARYGGSSR